MGQGYAALYGANAVHVSPCTGAASKLARHLSEGTQQSSRMEGPALRSLFRTVRQFLEEAPPTEAASQ